MQASADITSLGTCVIIIDTKLIKLIINNLQTELIFEKQNDETLHEN